MRAAEAASAEEYAIARERDGQIRELIEERPHAGWCVSLECDEAELDAQTRHDQATLGWAAVSR